MAKCAVTSAVLAILAVFLFSYGCFAEEPCDLVSISLGAGKKFNNKVAYFSFADPRISLDAYNFYEKEKGFYQMDCAFSILSRQPKLFEPIQVGISALQDEIPDIKLVGHQYQSQVFFLARYNLSQTIIKLYFPLAFQSQGDRWYGRIEIENDLPIIKNRNWQFFISSDFVFHQKEGLDSSLGVKIRKNNSFIRIDTQGNYFLCIGVIIKSYKF